MGNDVGRRFEGKRVMVTGGAGFIGSHLVDGLLSAGADRVAVVDNFFLGKEANLSDATATGDRVAVYREDAAEFPAMAAVIDAEKPDVVFNLATKALLYSFFNPAGACRVNLDIATGLAEFLRAGAYGKLVHVSTSEVYGTAVQFPMDEQHPLLAETTYAAGKAAADLLLTSYVNMFGLDISIVRPFNNYGPRQNDGSLAAVVPLTIKRIRNGEKPVVEGDGEQTRDFIYVGDTVNGILRLALSDNVKGDAYNLGSGRETSINQIVETLSGILDYKGGIDRKPERKADVRRHMADVSKARSVIGEFAVTSLEDGLVTTAQWYRENAGR